MADGAVAGGGSSAAGVGETSAAGGGPKRRQEEKTSPDDVRPKESAAPAAEEGDAFVPSLLVKTVAGAGGKRRREEKMSPDVRPKGLEAPANFEKLIEEEGYAVVPGLVDKAAVQAAVGAIEARVETALAGYGVDNPGSMESLLQATKHFGTTPANWTGLPFGGFSMRGWVKAFGGGRLFQNWKSPPVEACREATREVVARWHRSAGWSVDLRAMPEKCSMKVGGCEALPAHLDMGRVGSLQIVIALSVTEVVLWPCSHKIRFNPGGSGSSFRCSQTPWMTPYGPPWIPSAPLDSTERFKPGMEPQSADGSGGKPKGTRGETPGPNRPMGRVGRPRESGGKLRLPGYYKLLPADITNLKKVCSQLTIPVNPGDVVFFAGGKMVHSSPAVPAGAAVRFMTYAHWEEAASATSSSEAKLSNGCGEVDCCSVVAKAATTVD